MRRVRIILSLTLLFLSLPLISNGQCWNVEMTGSLYNLWGQSRGIAVSGDYAYIAEGLSGLFIVDISDPLSPIEAGYIDTPYDANGVAVSGIYAYVADMGGGLRIIDVSNPTSPVEINHIDSLGYSYYIAVSGNYAYTAGWIINIENPLQPIPIGNFTLPVWGTCYNIVVSGNYAYVADGEAGLRILDISNPASPFEVGNYFAPGEQGVRDVKVSGNYAYIADCDGGLRIINIQNPAHPVEVGCYTTPDHAVGLDIAGNYVYLADFTYFRIIDVSNPNLPVEIGVYSSANQLKDVAVSGDYVYAADNFEGLIVFDVQEPAAPTLASALNNPGKILRTEESGNYLYIADELNGLRIADISDPSNPVETGFFGIENGAKSVAVQGNYAYIASVNPSLKIIDISNPSLPVEAGNYPGGIVRDIAVSGPYAYLLCANIFNSLLKILDISIPSNPVLISVFPTEDVAYRIFVQGDYAYISDGDCLSIVNISNVFAPTEVGNYDYNYNVRGVAISGNFAFVAMQNGLSILNIASPAWTYEVGYIILDGAPSDVKVLDNFAYVSSSLAGLRIVNVSNPHAPVEVGYYDTDGSTTDAVILRNYAFAVDYSSLKVLNCSEATAEFQLSIEPEGAPIEIPADGGEFQYDLSAVNSTPTPMNFQVWNMVDLPNGTQYGPVLGPANITMQSNSVLSRTRNQTVPGNAPSGSYIYWTYAGIYPDSIIDSDSFEFVKQGTDLNGGKYYRWYEWGEGLGESLSTEPIVPLKFSFDSVYPNPFNNSTTITFTLPSAGEISLKVFDISGREVQSLVTDHLSLGTHSVVWDAKDNASGIYFVQLEAGGYVKTEKVILLK